MNFVADEGIDRQIVERLRQEDYEVLYIAEMEPGISDEQVLNEHAPELSGSFAVITPGTVRIRQL